MYLKTWQSSAYSLWCRVTHAQAELKKKGYPWTLAKSFPAACAIGPWADLQPGADLSDMTLHLEVRSVTVWLSSRFVQRFAERCDINVRVLALCCNGEPEYDRDQKLDERCRMTCVYGAMHMHFVGVVAYAGEWWDQATFLHQAHDFQCESSNLVTA